MIYIQGNKLRDKQSYHSQKKTNSLKNVFTSLRMTQYSIFTSPVVTSDVISAKMSGYSKIKLGVQSLIFLISNTDFNKKIGCTCIKVY